jgi:hypothetical protein
MSESIDAVSDGERLGLGNSVWAQHHIETVPEALHNQSLNLQS